MKRRPKVFSVTKAVKRNARDRVGTPPPVAILPDDKLRAGQRADKHKVTLTRLLQESERD